MVKPDDVHPYWCLNSFIDARKKVSLAQRLFDSLWLIDSLFEKSSSNYTKATLRKIEAELDEAVALLKTMRELEEQCPGR